MEGWSRGDGGGMQGLMEDLCGLWRGDGSY